MLSSATRTHLPPIEIGEKDHGLRRTPEYSDPCQINMGDPREAATSRGSYQEDYTPMAGLTVPLSRDAQQVGAFLDTPEITHLISDLEAGPPTRLPDDPHPPHLLSQRSPSRDRPARGLTDRAPTPPRWGLRYARTAEEGSSVQSVSRGRAG